MSNLEQHLHLFTPVSEGLPQEDGDYLSKLTTKLNNL